MWYNVKKEIMEVIKMNKSKVADINGITVLDISNMNCWMVNLKPTWKDIKSFQQKCINKKVFGIGWTYQDHYETQNEIILDDNNRKEYIKAYNAYADKPEHKWGHISKSAMKEIDMMGKGDIVMMRLRDGHYYIGRISKEAFYRNDIFEVKEDNEIMSWMCEVEKWYEIKSADDLPAEITGRFSQKLQSTITRISPERTRLLMIKIYDEMAGTQLCGVQIPKINITYENYARSLNYMELENLVCKYIYDKHKDEGYMLLPSSGKVSQMKYEFTFVNDDENKKPITCQVKNQNKDPIKASEYTDDFNIYEKIYLFSGNENIDMSNAAENIVKIEKKDLYATLESFLYLKRKLSKYYSFDKTEQNSKKTNYEIIKEKLEENSDWKNVKQFRKKNKEYVYKLSTDINEQKIDEQNDEELSANKWIAFVYYDFFYTEDFDCFVIRGRVDYTDKVINSVIELMK